MAVLPDEIAVRRLLDVLTVGQPDPPPDRHGLIRRRVRRHRVAQAAGTLGAVAAAAIVAVGIGTSARSAAPDTGPRTLPAWALPWPDHRNGSVPQGVLDRAVRAWRHQAAVDDGTLLPPTARVKPIWYVGQTADNGEVVVVVFEANSGADRRLVAGWATASQVMHGQPAWSRGSSPWVFYDVAAPRASRGLFIGLNVHGTTALAGRNPDDWIVVLTDPRVQEVGWTAPGPTATTSQEGSASGSEKIGLARPRRGLAIIDTGQITGKPQVTQLEVHPRNLLRTAVPVGVPGSAASQVPQLATPRPISYPPGFTASTESGGQGSTLVAQSGIQGRLAILARCYGPSNLRLIVGPPNNRTQVGAVRCDDAAHQVTTQFRMRPRRHVIVQIDGSDLTSFRVVVGTVR